MTCVNYYVDESGSGVLFNRKGKVIVGTEGAPRYFILGLCRVEDPDGLARDLNRLRKEVLSDPFYAGATSLEPSELKTAVYFHAKDDLPEIREKVFKALMEHEVRFSAIVKDLYSVLDYTRSRRRSDPTWKYHPNDIYDLTVRMLFRQKLHKEEEYHIFLAKRGKRARAAAFDACIETARRRYGLENNIEIVSKVHVTHCQPQEHAGLQAVDYFLWALQRAYNTGEDRFIQYIWPKVSVVHDHDDKRNAKGWGVYYNRRNKLTAGKIKRTEEARAT